MGVLGGLPKPSASTGVTKAQGKSSRCQQGVSVTGGTTSGCLGQEVLAEQPLAAGCPECPTGGHLTEIYSPTPAETFAVTQFQLRGTSRACREMLMCQEDTFHSPVHPQCHTEKDLESPPGRARLWTALTAGPEEAAGQEFLSWASAAAQHINPELAQM